MILLFGSIGYFWQNHPLRAYRHWRTVPSISDQYARAGRGYLRVHPRLYADQVARQWPTPSAPERQAIMTRSCEGAGVRGIPHRITARHQGTRTLADGDRRCALSKECPGQDRPWPAPSSSSNPPSADAGAGMPLQYVLQATRPWRSCRSILPAFMQKVKREPGLPDGGRESCSFTGSRRHRIEIDRDKASFIGRQHPARSPRHLQYALSGQRMGYFYMNGKQYQILGEINRQQLNTPVDLKSIYVRSNNGEMIQLDDSV